MGTNYYAKPRQDPLGLAGEGLHIGKSSGGWEFLWRGHPERGLRSVADWRAVLGNPDVVIEAEHGTRLELDEFMEIVRRSPGGKRQFGHATGSYWADREWRDPEGYPFAGYEFC